MEGLTLAISLFDEVWVFHDPGARTFHPKVYAVEGDKSAQVVVGSGNLTKGGLFTNYEAAVHLNLLADSEEDRTFLASASDYFDRFTGSEACLPLDAELIERLKHDPRILLLSERRSNARRAQDRDVEADASVFGSTAVGDLLGAPAPSLTPLSNDSDDGDDLLPPERGDRAFPEGGAVDNMPQPAIRGFFKALSANDVSLKGSPGQIIIPKSFLPFFGDLEVQTDEKSSGGPRQSHREFALTYRNGGVDKRIPTGRVVLYEPASSHKRQNNEVRFTFHDRPILEGLQQDDVLVFGHDGDGHVLVEHHPAGWRPDGIPKTTRYGVI
ncbi:MAG TPA: phospholipase D family protein [Solirubrobacterales bacterium]|nr:phospholipase D family protein [Solirubrobacterales bacterium]